MVEREMLDLAEARFVEVRRRADSWAVVFEETWYTSYPSEIPGKTRYTLIFSDENMRALILDATGKMKEVT